MMDQLPPHSIEAEEAVLGSLLIDPECLLDVRGILSKDDFYREVNQFVFEAIESVYPAIDQVTVSLALSNKGRLEMVGGHAYLSELSYKTPVSIYAEHYAKIVAQKAYQRRIIQAAGQIAAKGYDGSGDSAALFMDAQQILSKVEPVSSEDIIDAPARAGLIRRNIERRRADAGQTGVIDFPYRDLTALIGGMNRGNLVITGARPGMGKSQVLLETGLFLGRFGYSVMIASAEMGINEWNERELAILTGVPVKEQRSEGIPEGLLVGALDIITKLDSYWLKEPVTISKIVNRARVLKNTLGLDILILDYIQLIADTVSREYGSNIRERVGYISRTMKRLAKELDIVVLAAAQLNRDLESREDKRPRMSDLKESGDIEQDADIIILIHRPSVYKKNEEKNVTRLYVPKIRQIGQIGEPGCVKLTWKPEISSHVDMAVE